MGNSSVSEVTGYGVKALGLISWQREAIFFVTSRQLWGTSSFLQWVKGTLSPGMKYTEYEADHSQSLNVFMAWCLGNRRNFPPAPLYPLAWRWDICMTDMQDTSQSHLYVHHGDSSRSKYDSKCKIINTVKPG
jgi:hypothetical protein